MHRVLAAVLGLLLAFPALAQTRTGPLVIQNALGEIAANGTQATARANLGLPLGTSGATVPLLSGANTWSAAQTLGGAGTGLAVINDASVGGAFGVAGTATFGGPGPGLAVTNDATIGGNLTVLGTITGAGGSFLPLAGGTLTGPLSGTSGAFTGALGVVPSAPIVLSGAITAAQQPFNSFVTYSGTPGVDATYQYHSFITNDSVHHTAASNAIAGSYQLKLNAGWTGSRVGLGSSVNLLGQGGATAGSVLALWGDVTGTANQGGSATTIAGAAGSIWAGLLNTTLLSTATNYALFQGLEVDLNTVGTTIRRHGIQVSLGPADVNRGTIFDAAIVLGNSVASAGTWKHGLLLGEDSSRWPFASDSSLISAKMGQDDVTKPAVAAFGMDFVDVTFGTAAFRTNGLSVDGTGNLQIGTGYLQPVTAGLTIDTKGAVGNTADGAGMLVSGGSGWAGGEVLTDPYGGRYKVATVGAGVITALTVYRQPVFPTTTTPANPVTLGVRSGTDSVPPTINITWNTTGNALSLQPTAGGKLAFNGATPIVKATPVGACAGNTGCQAVRDALGNLGLINTGSISN